MNKRNYTKALTSLICIQLFLDLILILRPMLIGHNIKHSVRYKIT